jgi:hypothetical protein
MDIIQNKTRRIQKIKTNKNKHEVTEVWDRTIQGNLHNTVGKTERKEG